MALGLLEIVPLAVIALFIFQFSTTTILILNAIKQVFVLIAGAVAIIVDSVCSLLSAVFYASSDTQGESLVAAVLYGCFHVFSHIGWFVLNAVFHVGWFIFFAVELLVDLVSEQITGLRDPNIPWPPNMNGQLHTGGPHLAITSPGSQNAMAQCAAFTRHGRCRRTTHTHNQAEPWFCYQHINRQ